MLSLYKTSYTRCAFLGISNPGDEYNDIPSISSSVTTTSGFTTKVRRRKDMGEAGVLGEGVDGGAVGWRRMQKNTMGGGGGAGDTTRGGGAGVGVGVVGCGVGILQLLLPNQDTLVPTLGKRTGWDRNVNKREECASLGYEWVTISGW
jgi:hypothetical protein